MYHSTNIAEQQLLNLGISQQEINSLNEVELDKFTFAIPLINAINIQQYKNEDVVSAYKAVRKLAHAFGLETFRDFVNNADLVEHFGIKTIKSKYLSVRSKYSNDPSDPAPYPNFFELVRNELAGESNSDMSE